MWVVEHQTNKGKEEFYQTAEKFRTAIPNLITPYAVEGLDIELAREIGQEELGLDLEEALEHLQEPDGGFWFNVFQGEILTAISLRMTEKLMRWFWISIVIQIALIAVGYFLDRRLKLPRYIESQLEKIQSRIWRGARRYLPLLMILLSVITIGIRISVARRIMRDHTFGHNQDVVLNDCLRIVAGARQWYRKPTDLGGGEGSWDGLSFDVLPVQPSTPNGSYAFTANEAVLTVTGTGVVQNSKGEVAHITSTYDATTDSLKSLVEASMYY